MEFYFCDKNHKPKHESKATHVIIRELDAQGDLIQETFGTLQNKRER